LKIHENIVRGKVMKWQRIRALARGKGIKAMNMGKTELIRAIQLTEGNQPCFNTLQVEECGQDNCLWREDCLTTATQN